MVVSVFLVVACFVKIALCNPYTSMLNNKFPTITTSYATNILPEEYVNNIPSCDSYSPSILHEMTYPTEEIRLNYPSVLSRPMAITPLPMPRDLSGDALIPEINFLNNGYEPGKISCHKNYKYDSAMPKLINDIPTPKYQFKPFTESYNAYRENLLKNEPNLRSNAVIPQNTVLGDFSVIDNRNYPMCDLDDNITSPPLKIPLKPQQAPYELPIQNPLIDYNFNTCQDSLDGLEYIKNKNEIASPVFPGPSDIFFNQATSILNDGKFLEEEIQIPRTYTYNNNKPFDSSLLKQQSLLLNNFAVQEKQSKRTTDLNNLSNFDIDINIVDNTCKKNIPIEISISDPSDILINTDNEETSCIIIDICNENSDINECSTGQVKIEESDAPSFQLATNFEVTDDTQKIDSMGFERFNLKDFSTYLAESILSALQTYALQPISSNIKDNKANDSFTCADITIPLFNKPESPCGPFISSQSHETPNIKTKTKDKMKANKIPDKSIDTTTNKTSLPSQSTNKESEVTSNINATTITSKDMSKDTSLHTSFPSSINKTSEIASTINICPTKGKDIYSDKATQVVITSNSKNKTSEVEATTKTAPIRNESEDISKNKAPQTSLSSDNKNKSSMPKLTMDTYPISDKSKEISTDETKKTSLPPNNTGAMSESSTCAMTSTSSQTPLAQSDKVAAKPSHTTPQPCISTIKINISPLKDNLHQIVVFV